MSQSAAYSVIHRKAKVARDEFDAREMSPAKALRLSMAKTAENLFNLALVVRTIEQLTLPLQQMEEALGENGMLIMLDGRDGLHGVVKLDHALVTAFIEVQLIGRMRDRMPDERPFTPTDAAITQPLINEVLASFHQILAEDEIESGADGLRFGDMAEDARTLVLDLEAPDYELYRLNVDLGPGKRTGLLELYLPHRPQMVDVSGAGAHNALAQQLERATMNAPVTLDAALARLRLPLSELLAWSPGQVLNLDLGVLSDGILLGAGGHEVAQFKLGQTDGFRAVQLLTRAGHEEDDEAPKDAADAVEDQGEVAQIASSDAMMPPEPGQASVLDGTDAAGALPDVADESDWPALEGLDDASDDLDGLLDDIPEEDLSGADAADPLDDFSADLELGGEGDDGDFAPLPMMVADIDLDD